MVKKTSIERTQKHFFLITVAALLGTATGNAATPVESGYNLDLGVGHSNNIRRAAAEPESDTMFSAGAAASASKESRRLRWSFDGVGEYLKYQDDTFDADFRGSAVGALNLQIIENHFNWDVRDNFGQARISPSTEVDVPANRENVNLVSTGPEISLNFGARTELILQGRYSLLTYENSRALNEERELGDVELRRQLSSATSLSLRGSSESVHFTEEMSGTGGNFNDDYSNNNYTLRYELNGARTQIGLEAGYTEISFESGKDSSNMATLDVTRELGVGSYLRLSVGSVFTNFGNSVRQFQQVTEVGLNAQPLLLAGDPFRREYLTLGWDFQRNRTNIEVSAGYNQEDHMRRPELNGDWWTADVTLGRRFLAALSGYVSVRYMERVFDLPGGDYAEFSGSVGIDYRLGARLSVLFSYDRFGRDADILDSEYRENQYWLRLRYGAGNRQYRY